MGYNFYVILILKLYVLAYCLPIVFSVFLYAFLKAGYLAYESRPIQFVRRIWTKFSTNETANIVFYFGFPPKNH